MKRLWDLAGLFMALVLLAAVLVTPGVSPEARFGAALGIIGAALVLARFGNTRR